MKALLGLLVLLFAVAANPVHAQPETILTASDAAGNDYFGESVAIDGDYAVVGAISNDPAGAAYIFVHSNSGWVQQAILRPSDGGSFDRFGASVAIDGDYVIVGAHGFHDPDLSYRGAAYVFHRSGSTWIEQAKLTASVASNGDNFGISVAIDGDYAVVGAHQAINGRGAAYVFRRSGSSWTQEARLADYATGVDDFGISVAISGDYAVIGAYGDGDNGSDSGSAYVFRRSGSTWTEEAKLTASDGSASDYFGSSVSLDGEVAVVGAWGDDDNGDDSGSAYVFRRSGSSWTQEAKLTASDGATFYRFGTSVATEGDIAVIGAYGGLDDNDYRSGSAYVFRRSGSSWTQEAKLTASDGAADDRFGTGVAIEGGVAVVGAPWVGTAIGAAYVLELVPELSLSASSIDVPDTPVGGTTNGVITVSNLGFATLAVSDITSSDPAFSASPSSFSLLAGATEVVTVTFTPPTAGDFESEITLTHNGGTSPDAVTASGTARGAEISLQPSALSFPTTAVNGTTTRTLTVGNDGLLPLEVTGVESTDPAFSAATSAFTVPVGEEVEVEVAFTPPAAGAYEGELVLTHNGPTSPDAVALTGLSDPTGLAFSPTSLNFGTVDTGVTSSRNLQLTRDGPASEITVTSVYASDPAFDAEVETPFTVTSAVNVPVTFTPQAGLPYAGYVYFAHDGTTGLDSVAVAGTGEYNARLTELATYTVATNFVNVFFRATDPSGRGLNIPGAVLDQNVDLFRVRDDGTEISPTAPETFYQVLKFDEVPYRLRTVLLLDNSTSVGNDLPEIRDAARTIVDNLAPSQELALYVFDSQVTLLQDFTDDPALLHAAIDGIDVGSPSTALYNGLLTGLDRWEDLFELTDNGEGNVEVDIERGFLVLLSDGEDTAGGASLSEVLDARGDKRIYAVGYGDVNGSVLNQVGNAGVYSVDTADDLPAAFAEVQAEIENDAQSFYLLNYSSPRRSDQTWPLEICLRDNAYTGPGACAETSYTSTGFTDPIRGVFVNRSIENLYGVEEVEVHAGGVVLTATTILGLNEPEYEWTSSDASQVTVEVIAGTNQAIATRVGPAGGTATITVTDVANNLMRSVNANLIVPVEEGAAASGFALGGVYPNPARGRVQIAFEVGAPTDVRMTLYDVLGRRVLTAHDGMTPAGAHTVSVDTRALASGLYLLRVEAGDASESRRLTLVR